MHAMRAALRNFAAASCAFIPKTIVAPQIAHTHTLTHIAAASFSRESRALRTITYSIKRLLAVARECSLYHQTQYSAGALWPARGPKRVCTMYGRLAERKNTAARRRRR